MCEVSRITDSSSNDHKTTEKAMLNASSNTSASRPGSPGKQLMLSAREYNTPKILSPSLNHLQLRPNFIPPSSCSKKSEIVSPTLAGMSMTNAGGVDAQHYAPASGSQHQQQYYYEAAVPLPVPPPQPSQYTTPALQIPIPGNGCDTSATSPMLAGPAQAAAHQHATVVATKTNPPQHLLVEQVASLGAHTLSSSQVEYPVQKYRIRTRNINALQISSA